MSHVPAVRGHRWRQRHLAVMLLIVPSPRLRLQRHHRLSTAAAGTHTDSKRELPAHIEHTELLVRWHGLYELHALELRQSLTHRFFISIERISVTPLSVPGFGIMSIKSSFASCGHPLVAISTSTITFSTSIIRTQWS